LGVTGITGIPYTATMYENFDAGRGNGLCSEVVRSAVDASIRRDGRVRLEMTRWFKYNSICGRS
jgi:hypothetical protein